MLGMQTMSARKMAQSSMLSLRMVLKYRLNKRRIETIVADMKPKEIFIALNFADLSRIGVPHAVSVRFLATKRPIRISFSDHEVARGAGLDM